MCDEIYVVLTFSNIDEENVNGCSPCYFTDKVEAVGWMLDQAQSVYDEWKTEYPCDVTTHHGVDSCFVSDSHTGDHYEWQVVKLTKEDK